MGVFLGSLKFQIFFGVLEIPDIFFWGGGLTVDAGPEPMYEEKMREPPPPPWDTCNCELHDIFVLLACAKVWLEPLSTYHQCFVYPSSDGSDASLQARLRLRCSTMR